MFRGCSGLSFSFTLQGGTKSCSHASWTSFGLSASFFLPSKLLLSFTSTGSTTEILLGGEQLLGQFATFDGHWNLEDELPVHLLDWKAVELSTGFETQHKRVVTEVFRDKLRRRWVLQGGCEGFVVLRTGLEKSNSTSSALIDLLHIRVPDLNLDSEPIEKATLKEDERLQRRHSHPFNDFFGVKGHGLRGRNLMQERRELEGDLGLQKPWSQRLVPVERTTTLASGAMASKARVQETLLLWFREQRTERPECWSALLFWLQEPWPQKARVPECITSLASILHGRHDLTFSSCSVVWSRGKLPSTLKFVECHTARKFCLTQPLVNTTWLQLAAVVVPPLVFANEARLPPKVFLSVLAHTPDAFPGGRPLP